MATALTQDEWPLSVCSEAPVAASQSLTVRSPDAEATSLPSGEKATALTSAEWPSSVSSAELHPFCTFDTLVIQPDIWPSNCFRTKAISGANIRHEEYIWRGASSIIDGLLRTNRWHHGQMLVVKGFH